jgi:2-ketoarginine methyltransferase
VKTLDPTVFANAHPGFEARLVAQLQPIRNFALAVSLYHLCDLGIADLVRAEPGITIDHLAARLGLDPVRLEGFAAFLHVEGYLVLRDGTVAPGEALQPMLEAWPWYEMLIGGYARTYLDMGHGLKAGSGPLSRNGASVGSGSCKISHYDAIPLTKALMSQIARPPAKVVDLGCGNALYLRDLCSMFPALVAVGVEPNAGGHAASAEDIAASAEAGRIRLYNTTAQDFIAQTHEDDADVLIIAFVLQEILGQEGRDGVVGFLRQLAARYPGAYVLVIEVEDRARDRAAMQHPLARGYYNPYYLVHHFTDQLLETPAFWRGLFAEAGLSLVAEATTNPNVDSTGLTQGFLLQCG